MSSSIMHLGFKIAILATAGLAPIAASAQANRGSAVPSSPADKKPVPLDAESKHQESLLLRKLHTINQAEVSAGKLAQERGQSEAVKNYGKMLQHDHQALDEHVKKMAESHKVNLNPPQKDTEVEKLRGDLSKMEADLKRTNATVFDKDFASAMVSAHRDAIKLVEDSEGKLAASATDVRKLSDDTLVMLKKHEVAAENLGKTGGMSH